MLAALCHSLCRGEFPIKKFIVFQVGTDNRKIRLVGVNEHAVVVPPICDRF